MQKVKLALPKGRLYEEIVKLLDEAGWELSKNGRSYRPIINDEEVEVKILKPQNIPKLVELGSQDIAFTGYDWIVEQNADVTELLDLGFNPVRLVAATPKGLDMNQFKKKPIRVASEYENISKKYLEKEGFQYVFIKSFGATEAFVPEDADMLIDNTSTGETLKKNNLEIYDNILTSSTKCIANKEALNDKEKGKKIRNIAMVLQSVIEGRRRLLIEMNVSEEKLDTLMPYLPCMKSPTIAKLYGGEGYAVKIAVPKEKISSLIPILKEKGATDIIVMNLRKVVA